MRITEQSCSYADLEGEGVELPSDANQNERAKINWYARFVYRLCVLCRVGRFRCRGFLRFGV